ncbi:MAG: Fe-S protein assembly co-chaperone HscB [Saprospiraceae bacterium]
MKNNPVNYFEFFGIPLSFQVDEAALRRVFYQNSKEFHPDFHTLADVARQAEMLELSTLNNEAFQTLSDPDKRMRYVLKIKGLLEDEGKLSVPQAFLAEMMEVNEALMELEFGPDPVQFAAAAQTAHDLEKSLDAGIRPVLDTYTEHTGTEADLRAVLEYFLKKRYLLRVLENLSKFAPQ